MPYHRQRAQHMRHAIAKSDGQNLLDHTLAVARYALSLCHERPRRRLLVQAAWYHDLGKLAHGFQQMIGEGAAWHFRHEILSALAFLAEHPSPNETQLQVLYAILSHHRDLDDGELLRQLRQDEALRQYLQQLPPDLFPPLEQLLDAARQLQAYLHWQLDNPSPLLSDHTLMRGLLIAADHAASAGFSHALPVQRQHCRPHLRRFQQEAAAVEGNLLLEAPTGAGKTDAALLWYQTNRQHPAQRLFYVLPYRASIEAMRRRLQAIYGEDCVAAVHGRDLEYAYAHYLNHHDSETALQRARQDVHANRLVHKPVKILTPYQILKYLLGIKRFEVGIAEMRGALFVFDEVHAYDVHTLSLVLEALPLLRQLEARVLVMTATLPDLLRNLLEQALAPCAHLSAYGTPELPSARHRLQLLRQPLEACAPLIRGDLAEGKSVLVVCNRVAQAQQLYQQFADVTDSMLLHARFTYRDREQREQAVQHSSRRPQLLIATQVVEVSLDISFDTCYTEVAPVDDLLQRFGRVNRNGEQPEPAVVHVCTEYDAQALQRIYDLQRLHDTAHTAPDGEVLTPEVTLQWLNQVYQSFTSAEESQLQQVRSLFRQHLQQLHPYRSVPIQEQHLEQLYRTVDAVPQSLLDEYCRLLESKDWLQARLLLVPVSTGDRQLRRLGGGGYLIERPYNSELGLLQGRED